MAIQCKRCGKQYDIALFQFGNSINCDCGDTVFLSHYKIERRGEESELIHKIYQKLQINAEDSTVKELQRLANRVCFFIVSTDYPEVDIEIEKEKVKNRCRDLFPDKVDLFEMIYESRFKRLWEQFRCHKQNQLL